MASPPDPASPAWEFSFCVGKQQGVTKGSAIVHTACVVQPKRCPDQGLCLLLVAVCWFQLTAPAKIGTAGKRKQPI